MMTIESALVYQSSKLGDVTYTSEDVIRFPQGIPGFENFREFLLVTREECDPFIFLAALEHTDVALPLMPLAPSTLSVRPSAAMLAPLAISGDDTIAYYAVASIGLNATQIIVNLRAPIVINPASMQGIQLLSPESPYELDHPLLRG